MMTSYVIYSKTGPQNEVKYNETLQNQVSSLFMLQT